MVFYFELFENFLHLQHQFRPPAVPVTGVLEVDGMRDEKAY